MTARSRKIVGIDIGGTKISMVLANDRGRVVARKVLPTRKGSQAGRSVKEMFQALSDLFREHKVKHSDLLGIGVGFPGAVNIRTGIVPWSPNMKGWEGIELKKLLARKFRVPVQVDNDANAAAFGEKVFGAGRKAKDLLYLTISTGIGGGLVLGGKIHRGASFSGGEVGHATIVPDGRRCNCGKKGCLEAYASGTAIARMAQEKVRSGMKSKLRESAGGIRSIDAEMVSKAAHAGDRLSIQTLGIAGRYLGIGVANLLNTLNPDMVVLGGSVVKAGAYLWRPFIRSVQKEAWPEAYKACRIRRTALGDDVGNLGAAALVLDTRG